MGSHITQRRGNGGKVAGSTQRKENQAFPRQQIHQIQQRSVSRLRREAGRDSAWSSVSEGGRNMLNVKGLREHAILATSVKKIPQRRNPGDRDMSQNEEQRLGKDFWFVGTPNVKNQAESCDKKWLLSPAGNPTFPESPSATPHLDALSWVLRSPLTPPA